MTREEALQLIEDYCTLLQRDGETDETFTRLRSRFPEEGSEKKAMRWLGFMQGALLVSGRFTLDELKAHSRDKRVPLDAPPSEARGRLSALLRGH